MPDIQGIYTLNSGILIIPGCYMAANTLSLLTKAANSNRRAIVRYDGQTNIRVVEPHVIYSEEDGTMLADCFQVRGHSGSTQGKGFWKTFELGKIHSVFLLDASFEARTTEGFVPNQPKYLNNLLAMIKLPVTHSLSGKRPQQEEENEKTLYHQARRLWWQVGNTIDRVLSNRDIGPKGH